MSFREFRINDLEGAKDMARNIVVIFFAFILLGATASELKGEKKNTLRAIFLDEAGRPVEGVKAYIEEAQSRKKEEKKSDKQGVALFKNLADGIYRVVGRKEDFAPGYSDGLRLEGGVEQKIQIALKPGDPTQKVYFEDPALQQKAFDLMVEGVEALKANKFDEAAQKLKESAEINPSNPDAYFNLAIAQIQTSRWEEAEENLARAIELQPQQQRYQEVKSLIPVLKLNAEGNQALGKRDFKTAIEKFSEMLKLQPNNPEVYYSLALAYTHDNQFDKASEFIEKALAGKPNEPEFLNLKKARSERGQPLQEHFRRGESALSEQRLQERFGEVRGGRPTLSPGFGGLVQHRPVQDNARGCGGRGSGAQQGD